MLATYPSNSLLNPSEMQCGYLVPPSRQGRTARGPPSSGADFAGPKSGLKSNSTVGQGDRFIPCRGVAGSQAGTSVLDNSPMDMSISDSDSESSYNSKCSECAYKALIQENYNRTCLPDNRVLRFVPPPTPLDSVLGSRHGRASEDPRNDGSSAGLCASLQATYKKAKETVDEKKKAKRRIPRKPERILDAPELLDDYYLNLVDWSASNRVAVCLGHSLYVWDASTGTSQQAITHDSDRSWNVLTAVAWSPQGDAVAVGAADHSIKIWDAATMKCKAVLPDNSHEARISALAWNGRNGNILASGSRDSLVLEHDMRMWQRPICKLHGHTQEVCGLKWSPEGLQLATGGNDNCLCMWDLGSSVPRFTRPNDHVAAVKAIAWCPWQSHVFATGGGTADKCIKFWDSMTGECLRSYQAESQICAMLFNPREKELITSHGFTTNQITIWRYPTMDVVSELKGHKSRVLYMAMSPDASTIVSGSADETLRFWKINAPVLSTPKKPLAKPQLSYFKGVELR